MGQKALKIDFPGVQTRLLAVEEQKVMECIHNAKVLTMGPCLAELENNFSRYLGVKHCLGVNSCTSALELAAMLVDLDAGDEVVVPAHTFSASALPFLRTKSRLVFVDIEKNTFVTSAQNLREKITGRTKVIVAVHLYGLMAPMKEIMQIAEARGITVIEDVAQAPGASIDGKKSGTWGNFSCFSFHSQKNITALGEGGLIATNDSGAYEKLLGLRKIGSRPYTEQKKYWRPAMANIIEAVPGRVPFNFALPEPNACAANCLLSRLDSINERRYQQAREVKEALVDFKELEFQAIPSGYKHVYHLLVARYNAGHSKRDDLIEMLYEDYGIKCVVQYNPLYNYDLFQKNGYGQKVCPDSDDFFENMISFPFWSSMPARDIDYMIESIRSAIMKLRKSR